MSAIAQRYYCRQCSKASLYLGEAPRYCNWCGIGFLTGLPANFIGNSKPLSVKPVAAKATVEESMFEIVDSASSSGDSEAFGVEIQESGQSLSDLENSSPEVVQPQPVPKPKRGRPSKKNKAIEKPIDLSWLQKTASIKKGGK